MIVFVCAAG